MIKVDSVSGGAALSPGRESSCKIGRDRSAARTQEKSMKREMLRAKVHRIRVTEANLEYEGSLTLDAELMQAGDFRVYEKVDVYNVTRGTRFTTYLIEGERGSGVCCVNGAAAHLAAADDLVIVASYATVEESEIANHRPLVVLVDAKNRLREIKQTELASARA